MTRLARTLGLGAEARVLIPHVDDVAVCHGANRAFVELCGRGFVTSGSAMVPCPWFPEVVDLANEQPEMDLGVHLTLTSESRSSRWRPISTISKASGLIDDDGYMWSNVPDLRHHADRGAVDTELRAQLEAALGHGLDVTHLDTHMGAAAAPEFVETYLALGREHELPVLLPRDLDSYLSVLEMGPLDRDFYDHLVAEMAAEGDPVIDAFAMGLAMRHMRCDEAYRRMVTRAVPGVTFVSLHCSTPGEVERLHPEDAEWRIAEYQLCDDPAFVGWVGRQDVRLVGFREIRDLHRGPPAAA